MSSFKFNKGDIVIATNRPGHLWRVVEQFGEATSPGLNSYRICACDTPIIEHIELQVNLFHSYEADLAYSAERNVVDYQLPFGYTDSNERKKRQEAGECIKCGAKRRMTIHGLADCEHCSSV